MGASQSQAEDDSHGHAHADGSIHHGHSHSGRIPASLTAAQLQAAPTVAPTAQYLSSTHAPVTLAAPSATTTTPVKSATTSTAATSAPPAGSSSAVVPAASTTAGPTLAQAAPATSQADNASYPEAQTVQGHHPQAAPTGVVNSTTTTSPQQSASATKTAAAAGGAAAVAVPQQQQQRQQPAVQTTSVSSYGAVPISGAVSAPVSNLTVVPTAGHTTHGQTVVTTTTGPGGVVRSEYHSAAPAPKEVVRPVELTTAAVLPGFASEAAAGTVATSQPSVHAGPSADRATLAGSPARAPATSTTHIAPISTGQAVAPPTLYQTLAPTAGDASNSSQPAATTQPTVARASATTAITAATVSSVTSSTATTAPATASATTATTTSSTAAATKSSEPSSPNRPAKVAKGMQTGLWSQLISWCNPLLPQGVVLAWDERDVADMVLALPHSADFKATLQQRQLERKKRRKQQAVEQAEAAAKGIKLPASSPTSAATPVISSPYSSTQLPVPYELASMLLSLDKTLSAMRLQWVPSRVSEDTFFVEYFGAIVTAINAHVTRVETELTGKVGGATVHDKVKQIEDRSKAVTA